MMLIVQLSHRLSQRLDTSRGPILAAMARNIHLLGPLEAALDLVVDLGRALAQVRPRIWVVEVAVLVGALRCPYHARRGTRGVETGMRLVTFDVTELAMDLGRQLCGLEALASDIVRAFSK